MTIASDPAHAFDTMMADNAVDYSVRQEAPLDASFLENLYVANAPMTDFLPMALLLQQHRMQEATFAAHYPHAMRRILVRSGQPVGRIILDWSSTAVAHGVDIGVLPHRNGRGGGLNLLRAWLVVCDALECPASLFVRADNRARRLYTHLGFAEVAGQANDSPMVQMTRMPG